MKEIKINKWDLIKLTRFCIEKENINKMKRQPTEWKKIFASYGDNKELVSKIYKQLNIKKYKQLNQKMGIRLDSLVSQWIGICLPIQGTRVQSLVCEDPICHGATKPLFHSY